MRRCREHGRRWCWSCVAFTLGFPVEHFMWDHTPLRAISLILGIH